MDNKKENKINPKKNEELLANRTCQIRTGLEGNEPPVQSITP